MGRLFTAFVCMACVFVTVSSFDPSTCIKCRESHVCNPPDCFCCRDKMPLDTQKIPQMVFFTFDDAVQPQVASYYRELFDSARRNPNGCPITMTLFVSHKNTVYSLVREFYEKGMEIASHSVNHGHPNPRTFINEAKKQKENLSKRARIPMDEIKGWRSPFLEPLGDIQPDVLQQLGYEYDATLTIAKNGANDQAVLPFTLDYGWPYGCKIKPCPTKEHKGFWQIPVVTVKDYKKKHDCVYVDGCNIPPPTEELAYKFLWDNFQAYYKNNRAPMGINMHASWFYYPYRKAAMNRFIEDLSKMDDVYIVTIRQVIDWLRNPTPLAQLKDFSPWRCDRNISTAVTEATSAFDVRQKKIQMDMQQRRQLQRQRPTEQRNKWQPLALQTQQRKNTDFTRRPTQAQSTQQEENRRWQMVREPTSNPPMALNFPLRFWWRRPPSINQFPQQTQMRPFAQQAMQRRRDMELRRRQDIIREQRRLKALEEQRTREEKARQEQQRQAELKQQEELKRLEQIQRQKELEIQKQKELERQKLAELNAQEQLKMKQELERQRLMEIKLQEELKRQAELERQQALQKQNENERLIEIKRQAEFEKQRLAEIKREEEIKRQAVLERQTEIKRLAEITRQSELKRQAQLERQKELERLAEIKRLDELKLQAESERQTEIQRQIEIQQQKELEQWRLAEIKRQADIKRQAEIQQQQEIQRQLEITKQHKLEQQMMAELRYQTEINRLKEMERKLMAETERQRIVELHRRDEMRQQAALQHPRYTQLEKELQLQLTNQQQLAIQHPTQIETIGPILQQTQPDNQNTASTITSADIMVNHMELQNELQRQTDIRRHLDNEKILAKLERQTQLEADKEVLRQQEITKLEEMKTHLHTQIANAKHVRTPDTPTTVHMPTEIVAKVTTNDIVKAETHLVKTTRTRTASPSDTLPTKIGSKAMWQVDISDLVNLQNTNQLWTSLLPKNSQVTSARPAHNFKPTRTSATNLVSITGVESTRIPLQTSITNPYIVQGQYTTKVPKQIKPRVTKLSFFETTNSLSREPVPVSMASFINSNTRSETPTISQSRTSFNPTTLAPSTLKTPNEPTNAYTTQPTKTTQRTADGNKRTTNTLSKTKLVNTPDTFTTTKTGFDKTTDNNESSTTKHNSIHVNDEFIRKGSSIGDYHSQQATKSTTIQINTIKHQMSPMNTNDPQYESQYNTNYNGVDSSETSKPTTTRATTVETKSTTQPVLIQTQTTAKTTPSTNPVNNNSKRTDMKPTYRGIQYFTSNPTVHGRISSAFSTMINLPPPSKVFPSHQSSSPQSRWSKFSSSYFNTSSTKQPVVTCKQGTNCIQPGCVCKSSTLPETFTAKDTPQMIYITVDGSINFHTYSKIRTLFTPGRMNPNGCRIKGTAFANDEGSSYRIGDVLKQNGMEIALMGMDSKSYTSVEAINRDINEQKSKIASSSRIPIQTLKGWRSPEFRNLGDEQFELLGNRGMYDSSLIVARSGKDQPKLWPFTLDFGWKENCEIGACPVKNHPGVWEIPVIPMRGPNDTRTCEYADGCTSQPSSEQDTFNYLMDNFNSYYKTNKAPFSIRLKQIWFHWHYRNNFAGLIRFLDKVLTFGDVYVTSIADVIAWMKAPTHLSELHTFKPWAC